MKIKIIMKKTTAHQQFIKSFPHYGKKRIKDEKELLQMSKKKK